MQKYFVYILICADQTLYTGIALNLKKRLQEHNDSQLGAKYTRTRRPVSLVYYEECESRSVACRREHQIKKLSRAEKMKLVESKFIEEPALV
ncbi:MAG: hypothetical protein KatS3mg087_1284 [Patescibacteria group bacterium]|nr:MAG: hypothetical protein KatS3mg087_1284 [Patescibacteria group bacterium]